MFSLTRVFLDPSSGQLLLLTCSDSSGVSATKTLIFELGFDICDAASAEELNTSSVLENAGNDATDLEEVADEVDVVEEDGPSIVLRAEFVALGSAEEAA